MNLRLAAVLALTLLSACRHRGDIVEGGIYAVRSACPIAGVPAGTGDITLFNPADSSDSRNIDVTAAITDVRATCQDGGNDVVSTATFTIVGSASRCGPGAASRAALFQCRAARREPTAAKSVGQAVPNFAAGDVHGWTRVQATIRVNRGAATLPADVRQVLTKPRKAGDPGAAIDPLSDPKIRSAVANATFEHLVGFQMTQDQLRYNATR